MPSDVSPLDDQTKLQELLKNLRKSRGELHPLDQEAQVAPVVQEQRMPSRVQDAIIQTESSGRPGMIGDVGFAAGDSRGLMQIQANTAKGLYNKGLLPKTWNGKKVKKNKLSELLLDPEFNKLAGSALFQDNRKILEKKARQRGVELSPDELDDLTIKSHNQGVGKTIRRDLLGSQPINPKVQEYLKKVRGQLPGYQDGGTVPPVDTVIKAF